MAGCRGQRSGRHRDAVHSAWSLRFDSISGNIIAQPNVGHAMQVHEPSTLGNWSGNVADGELPEQPARLSDFLQQNRDDVLVVRGPYGDWARTIALPAAALVAAFGLGWAGGLNWPEFASTLGISSVAQKVTPSPRTAEARPGGRIEGTKKATSTSDLQAAAPAVVGSIPKPLPASTHLAARTSNPFASQANASPSGAAPARPPLAPAPETRPTTISGWTVVDVRDGTAVLDGPDGIRMAARGDTIPGLGRIETIVRWGNRWIVATANGLIAAP
jgi:hypothetical protein